MNKPNLSTWNWITLIVLTGTILLNLGAQLSAHNNFSVELEKKADKAVVEIQLKSLEKTVTIIQQDVKTLLQRR